LGSEVDWMSWRVDLGIKLAAASLTCLAMGSIDAAAADLTSVTAADAPPAPYEFPQPAPYINLFQEVRVGAFAHNWIHDEGAPVDVSVEVLSSPLHVWDTPNPWIGWFFNPRLNAGGMINTGGKTSYGFAGLTWRIPIYGKFFFEGEFGGAVNTSPLRDEPDRVNTGCRFDFRESGGFGYQFTDNIDLILSIEHVSHASFCTHINPGLTQVGAKIGYKF
jgi:lipid A 3-O-deacylase